MRLFSAFGTTPDSYLFILSPAQTYFVTTYALCLLVLSIAASWYTASNSEEYLDVGRGYTYVEFHFWLGYWTLGLIAVRIIWGFVGPKHARFGEFLAGPGRLFKYAACFFKRIYIASAGHNPMGALVVVLMMLMVAAQAVTGLFLIDNTEIYAAP